MLRHYLRIGFRNLLAFKAFSLINVSGLAIGMACAILIYIWVADELSYDRFHEKADQLYRVYEEQTYKDGEVFHVAVTPAPLAEALAADFPEIKETSRYTSSWQKLVVRYGEKVFNEEDIYLVDPGFLRMFSFPLVAGVDKNLLTKPHSIVVSKSMAQKYFGDEDPLGKTLNVNGEFDFEVCGVIEDVPPASHIKFDGLMPFDFMSELFHFPMDSWNSNSFRTYVELTKESDPKTVGAKIKNLLKERSEQGNTELFLQPLTDIHLHSIAGGGNILYVQIFSMVAVFVLLVACVNFMNLSTARSARRAKEVGMRKVVGAGRRQIVLQFMGESILIAFLALVVAVILIELLMPTFRELSGKALLYDLISLNGSFILAAIAALTGLVSGSYPAVFLSSFKPVSVFQGLVKGGSTRLRKILVVFQFALSIVLIISTLVVYRQLSFIQDKNLGFNRDNIVYMEIRDAGDQNYSVFRDEVTNLPDVVSASATSALPIGLSSSTSTVDWEGKDPETEILFQYTYVDFGYLETMEMEMAEGRSFSSRIPSDSSAYVLNEEAVRRMGLASPVGSEIAMHEKRGRVIGVVKDFNYRHLEHEVDPLIVRIEPTSFYHAVIRVGPGDIAATMGKIESLWNRLNPGDPFEARFLDSDFDELYRSEMRMGVLFRYFAGLSLLISCLGLFGLASFIAEQRTKEIGIRKVLGASATNIYRLLSMDFIKLVVVATLIAWPAGYFVMNRWLEDFANRVDVGVMTLIVSASAALFIALATVSYQAIKAAVSNPVNSLRYE